MSDSTTVKSFTPVWSFTSSIRDPRSLAIMVASKQQQRVALVLLITCLDNKKKKTKMTCVEQVMAGQKRTLWTSSSTART